MFKLIHFIQFHLETMSWTLFVKTFAMTIWSIVRLFVVMIQTV